MKTTVDLPDALLLKARTLAARQGRPFRDFIAEAIEEKLGGWAPLAREEAHPSVKSWEAWKARLQTLEDGSVVNPEGIADEGFFESLDALRRETWVTRDPFGSV